MHVELVARQHGPLWNTTNLEQHHSEDQRLKKVTPPPSMNSCLCVTRCISIKCWPNRNIFKYDIFLIFCYLMIYPITNNYKLNTLSYMESLGSDLHLHESEKNNTDVILSHSCSKCVLNILECQLCLCLMLTREVSCYSWFILKSGIQRQEKSISINECL
jgi:hypothetical protein